LPYDLAYKLIQQDILLSVNSGSGISEARVEKGLPFRISEKWATIGDENRPWHIHLNMDEVVQARFVKEPRSDEGQSYSIRFFDSKGNLSMRANFTKMYDGNGNLIKEKVANFVEAIINMADQVISSLNHNHTIVYINNKIDALRKEIDQIEAKKQDALKDCNMTLELLQEYNANKPFIQEMRKLEQQLADKEEKIREGKEELEMERFWTNLKNNIHGKFL
jgi:hypothetical protein